MTLIGFAFKIAAAPFHLWAPDAYQGAPIPSAAFIASGSKVASFVVLGKIVLVGFGPVHGSAAWHAMIAGWAPVLAVLAALSIVIGNLVALAANQRSPAARLLRCRARRLHLARTRRRRTRGFSATLFYTTVYAFTLVGAFGVVALVRRETGGDDLAKFRRTPRALAVARRVHGDLHAFAGRPAAAGRIFRKILPLQRRDARRRKPRPALACRARALWQSHFPLLLPHRAEKDFR